MSWQPMFKQTENMINIYGYLPGQILTCLLEEFQTEESEYSGLPNMIIVRTYVPGIRHVLSSVSGQYAGELPWKDGDRYIAQVEKYKAAIEKRKTLDEETKKIKWESSLEGKTFKIDQELSLLDLKFSRGSEDLLKDDEVQGKRQLINRPVYVAQVIARKEELRKLRKDLAN